MCLGLSRFPSCHSDPAVAGEESLIISPTEREGKKPEMFRFPQHDR